MIRLKLHFYLLATLPLWAVLACNSPLEKATNPLIHADVPDMSIIRVGDTYYMSSTTMHMSPGVPIMKSNDLVNWKLVGYAYSTLDSVDALNLENGQSTYGRGSWASCLRYHNGTYYLSTFAGTTNKTYIYTTKDIENGPWEKHAFSPSYHDHTLFFDDNGKIYMIWGAGRLGMVELKEDLSGVKEETQRVLIENATAPAGDNIMLPAEGSQLFKVNGKYYLFNISWPLGGMRTVIVHRADSITGPYEGRVALQDRGIAQGGLIDTPEGNWYAYLFRDYGAVGRIPYLAPVNWEEGWPVIGQNGKVPDTLDLPASKGLIPGIVASDEFTRKAGEPDLPLVWQWNHNPDNELWSVSEREGFLRLKTGRVDSSFVLAKNTLTQRTIGPECFGSTLLDVSNMQDGDFAGLALLQKKYGQVGVKVEEGKRFIVMVSAQTDYPLEVERIPLEQDVVYFKAVCDFRDRKDMAMFYYSMDGKKWTAIGTQLYMKYTLPHFMGYRFGLFNYATKAPGGYADFDYFHISDQKEEQINLNPDSDFYVFLCFGQSNMEGNARIQPGDTVGINERFQMLATVDCPDLGREKGNWYTAKPPLSRCYTGLSPADFFGRTMVDSLPDNIRVGVVNVSVAGCRIELFMKDSTEKYLQTAPDWMLNMAREYQNNPYAYLVAMGKIAQRSGVIKGILLHQGESNPNDTLWTKKVRSIYYNLMNDLNLDAKQVPLLAGEMVSEGEGGRCAAMNKIIATLPEAIPSAYVISSEGCPARPDGLHFTADGYQKLGERYAAQMLSLLKNNTQ